MRGLQAAAQAALHQQRHLRHRRRPPPTPRCASPHRPVRCLRTSTRHRRRCRSCCRRRSQRPPQGEHVRPGDAGRHARRAHVRAHTGRCPRPLLEPQHAERVRSLVPRAAGVRLRPAVLAVRLHMLPGVRQQACRAAATTAAVAAAARRPGVDQDLHEDSHTMWHIIGAHDRRSGAPAAAAASASDAAGAEDAAAWGGGRRRGARVAWGRIQDACCMQLACAHAAQEGVQ